MSVTSASKGMKEIESENKMVKWNNKGFSGMAYLPIMNFLIDLKRENAYERHLQLLDTRNGIN